MVASETLCFGGMISVVWCVLRCSSTLVPAGGRRRGEPTSCRFSAGTGRRSNAGDGKKEEALPLLLLTWSEVGCSTELDDAGSLTCHQHPLSKVHLRAPTRRAARR